MKSLTGVHWAAAFLGALFCHLALALSWEVNEPPKIEKSAGTPIELVGSLASLTHEQTLKAMEPTEDTPPLEAEPPREQKLEDPKPLEKTDLKSPLPIIEPKKAREQPPKKVLKEKPKEVKKIKKVEKPRKVKKSKKKENRKQKASTRQAARQKGGGAKGRKKRIAGRAAIANYRGRVQSHLARYKRRPGSNARGTVVVSFTVRRSGGAIGIRLVRSSGNGAIDQAALSMVRRASPFPPIPAGGPSPMRFSVPVRYR